MASKQVGTQPIEFLKDNQGLVQVFLFNGTGASIYLGKTQDDSKPGIGVPVPPGIFIPPFTWNGEMWITCDVDNVTINYFFSKQLDWDDATNTSETANYEVTPYANDPCGQFAGGSALYNRQTRRRN